MTLWSKTVDCILDRYSSSILFSTKSFVILVINLNGVGTDNIDMKLIAFNYRSAVSQETKGLGYIHGLIQLTNKTNESLWLGRSRGGTYRSGFFGSNKKFLFILISGWGWSSMCSDNLGTSTHFNILCNVTFGSFFNWVYDSFYLPCLGHSFNVLIKLSLFLYFFELIHIVSQDLKLQIKRFARVIIHILFLWRCLPKSLEIYIYMFTWSLTSLFTWGTLLVVYKFTVLSIMNWVSCSNPCLVIIIQSALSKWRTLTLSG